MEELLRKESVKDKKRCTAKQDRIYFLGMLGFAVVVYFPLISQRLVNTYDGLWHGAYYMGGFWELSIGRWLLPAVDFLRFGIQTEPINALLTLSMIALAVAMLRRLFAVNDKPLTWLAGMGFVSGAVVGVWLSYRYTSPIFGLSFLLSAAAADHATRTEHIGKAIGESAVLLALSLGLYQANLACFCMILLAYLLRLLFRAEGKKQVHAHIAKSLGSAASGMILYWLVLKLVLLACGQQLASYNGAAEISVKSILLGLPGGILQAYQLFATYFFQNIYRHNTLQTFGLFIVVLAVIGVGFLRRFAQIVRRKDLEGALLCMAAMLVLPLSCNMMMLISSEAAWRMQMGAGLALFVPLCLLLLADDRPEREHDSKVRWLVLVLAVLIVYGNVYMMATDQEAMRQGRESLRVMSDRIVDDLMDLGYFDEGSQPTVMIVGRPSSNPSFLKTPLYTSANKYAQMGRFWLAPECAALSWQGVFEQITPVNITFCSYDQYVELLSTEDIEALPLYPQKGYIQQAGDVVIVKISEDYRVLED